MHFEVAVNSQQIELHQRYAIFYAASQHENCQREEATNPPLGGSVNQRRCFLQQFACLGRYIMLGINRQQLLPDRASFADIVFGTMQ